MQNHGTVASGQSGPTQKRRKVAHGQDIRALFSATPPLRNRQPLQEIIAQQTIVNVPIELSAAELTRKAEVGVVRIRLPHYDRQFIDQFKKHIPSATTSRQINLQDTEASDARVSKRQRISRQDSAQDVNFFASDSESIASPPSEGSIFGNHTSSESSESDHDVDMDDGSSVQTAESDVDLVDIDVKTAHPGKTKSTAQPASSKNAFARNSSGGHKMKNLLSNKQISLDTTTAPLSEIDDIFRDLVQRAGEHGLSAALKLMKDRPIRIATMCSGTESPLLAIQMIQDSIKSLGWTELQIDHLFSAEIVPYKQAYIERNFRPPIIFRDITELTHVVDQDQPMATTAYGGRVPVPTEVDIVIAGTSCVDFSGLNRHKKDIDGGGESGDTWRAVHSYCRAFRPAIVLLENVKGAAWKVMLEDYERIGYVAAGVLTDSKMHYIPHTRQRGYLACFDKEKLGNSENAGDRWTSLMEKLKRPASAPVSSFLVPDSKIAARRQMRNDDNTRTDVDWSTCEITQMAYRRREHLGSSRPVTHWSESGSILPPEHGPTHWFSKQVERVLDTIDGATLRKALPKNGMYDASYKTRIWDLSQNIYRFQDTQPFGISTCVTPSGSLYLSDAARPLAAEETLRLQGIPLDRISFTTETPNEMQDLAGNAMTSTVIGTAIIAALIVGHTMFPAKNGEEQQQNERLQAIETKQELTIVEQLGRSVSCPTTEGVETISLLDRARRSLRRCFCEGTTGTTQNEIRQCARCQHTSCITCGGNPVHDYRPLQTDYDRIAPSTFSDELKSTLPLRLTFGESVRDVIPTLHVSDKVYASAVTDATAQTFCLQDVKRTHCWTISYKAQNARLDLVVDGRRAEWRLYACADKHLPVGNTLRTMLQQPIARVEVTDDLLPQNGWLWRVPERHSIDLHLTASESKIASWWSRNGMPDFADHAMPEMIEVAVKQEHDNVPLSHVIDGTYKYLPDCGKACSSLYRRLDTDDDPLYLFLDPTRVGDPNDDCFVFSHNIELLGYDEIRPIVATVDAKWRPWSKDGMARPMQSNTRLIVSDAWKDCLAPIQFRASSNEVQILSMSKPAISRRSGTCSESLALMGIQVPSKMVDPSNSLDGISIDAEKASFFMDKAWMFYAMNREELDDSTWTAIDAGCMTDNCSICAPTRPVLRWKLDAGNIIPYEDQNSAALYERAIKSRPDPITINITNSSESMSRLTVALNVIALAHRAQAKLPEGLQDIKSAWRFDTAGVKTNAFQFRQFKLSSTRGIEPFDGSVDLNVELFPKQRLALAWMRKQEEGINFQVEEAEEATLPFLGWRAEVRSHGSLTIRGGICADHPGFGKTVTSLALIQAQLQEASRSTIETDLAERRPDGLICTAATLIICPAALLRQWADEIKAKLNWKDGLITIKTIGELKNMTLDKIKNAKVVIAARSIFGSEVYAEKLAAFAAIPGPATKSGRAFGQWLKHACRQVPKHLEIRQKLGVSELKKHIKERYKQNIDSEDFKATVPSRRLRGKNYVEGKQKRQTAQAQKGALGTIDVSDVDMPLFEMFYFNRLVVDEFHQCDSRELAAINAVRADKRWGLSATPAIGDFYDIAQIAALLGVPLRIGSDARGIMKIKNSRDLRKDMSSFEIFDLMRRVPSDAMHARIHEIDQLFLDTFVRQNIMDFAEMKYLDHLMPVQLSLAHRAIYMELSQYLNSLDMRIKKGNKSKIADHRQQRLNEAIESSTTAEEALSKAAAFADASPLEDMVRIRQEQIREIEQSLPSLIAKARTGEAETYDDWKTGVNVGNIGDRDAVEIILGLLEPSKIVKPSKYKKRSGSDDESGGNVKGGRGSGKRVCTAALNTTCNALAAAMRSTRYFQSIQKVQHIAQDKSKLSSTLCDNPGCQSDCSSSVNAAISALCGHILCRQCYTELKGKSILHCPAQGCSNTTHDHHLLWTNKLGDLTLSTIPPFGAKIEAAVNLIEQISSAGDQAILFVQFDNQLNHLATALAARGIPAEVVIRPSEAASQIDTFRTATPKVPVMVLNASDETAAGLNLQNANHVIFFSPLLRDTQYGYDSTMAQAIGRVRRHGQTKQIHVYRLFALDTIDVDILEHRERRTNALVEIDEENVARPDGTMDVDEPRRERTQLVKEDGKFSLRPQSWLIGAQGGNGEAQIVKRVKGGKRVAGWEDFSSLVKFSGTFTEDDE